jgi:hypothetical protein
VQISGTGSSFGDALAKPGHAVDVADAALTTALREPVASPGLSGFLVLIQSPEQPDDTAYRTASTRCPQGPYCRRAGTRPRRAPSLRAGFLTSAARLGASFFKMRDVSRHKSMDVLQAYVRDADL